MSSGSWARFSIAVTATLAAGLAATSCGDDQAAQLRPGEASLASEAVTDTTAFGIPMLPEGSFPPDYPAIKESRFDAEADAPFPATTFMSINRRIIVTSDFTFMVTAGRNGVESPEVEGLLFFQKLDATSGKPISQELVAVPECSGVLALVDGDSADPTAIPITCLDLKSGEVLSKGTVDAVDQRTQLSA